MAGWSGSWEETQMGQHPTKTVLRKEGSTGRYKAFQGGVL